MMHFWIFKQFACRSIVNYKCLDVHFSTLRVQSSTEKYRGENGNSGESIKQSTAVLQVSPRGDSLFIWVLE